MGARQLVVLHQGAIGDFILSLSVIEAVAGANGADSVTAVASAPSARLAAGRSVIQRCASPERMGLHTLFGPHSEADDALVGLLRDALCVLSFLSAPDQVIHDRLAALAPQARVASVDPRPVAETLAQRRHITAQWAACLARQGMAVAGIRAARIRSGVPSEAQASRRRDAHPRTDRLEAGPTGSARLAAGLTDRVAADADSASSGMVIHPGSGGRQKCWPVERFMRVADALAPGRISWLIGPVERERDPILCEAVERRAAATGEMLHRPDRFDEAAVVIAGASLFMGNDAGMTHVAAVLGVPTVAIFGPTDPCVWRPLGEHVRIVATERPGRPMAEVAFERVLDAVTAPG